MVDSEGFQYKYVPKDAIITEDNTSGKRRKKSTLKPDNTYIYMKKP
jgi:hypothetical protein